MSFEKTCKEENRAALKKHEKSEMLIFQSRIYEKLGNTQKAISTLTQNKTIIVDQFIFHEKLSDLYLLIGEKDWAI